MNQAHAEEIEEPWDREPSFTQLLLHDNGPNGKAKFHCLDVALHTPGHWEGLGCWSSDGITGVAGGVQYRSTVGYHVPKVQDFLQAKWSGFSDQQTRQGYFWCYKG